jgi:DNA modification methylase
MVERVQIGAATLYCGDCQEVLAGLAPADLLVTDPPYRLTSGGNTGTGWNKAGLWSDYENTGELVACDLEWADWLPLAYVALATDADAYVMANDRQLFPAHGAAMAAGFRFHRVLTWDKIAATPNRWYRPNCEFTLYLFKGKARTIAEPGSAAGVRMAQIDRTAHPTEKPVGLMQHYIRNSSKPGNLVLDCFMGTGTTGVAAITAGRRFIGIELERKWFDVACSRLENEGRQGPDLFCDALGESTA